MVKKVALNHVVLLADGVEARKAGREINVYSSQGKSFTTKQRAQCNQLPAGWTGWFPQWLWQLIKVWVMDLAVGILKTQLWWWAGDEVFLAEPVPSLHACHRVCWWAQCWEAWAVKPTVILKAMISPTWVLIISTVGTFWCTSNVEFVVVQSWELCSHLPLIFNVFHLMSLEYSPSH